MNFIWQKVLPRLKILLDKRTEQSCSEFPIGRLDLTGSFASDLIHTNIISGRPFLAARIGTTELEAITIYLLNQANRRHIGEKTFRYLFSNTPKFWWHQGIKDSLAKGAGMFSTDSQGLDTFASRFISDLSQIDILGSWNADELLLQDHLVKCKRIPLKDLEPYYNSPPWSRALQGMKVLVIHPFSLSIKSQYSRKEKLYCDTSVLPEFELITFKPVQTIANNRDNRFGSWSDALDHMCLEISTLNFDIAIIGAGSYGLPLGSFIKQMGRQAVHLGGATQIMFGVKGRRWESKPFFQALFNDSWVRPRHDETPSNSETVEGGCYW